MFSKCVHSAKGPFGLTEWQGQGYHDPDRGRFSHLARRQHTLFWWSVRRKMSTKMATSFVRSPRNEEVPTCYQFFPDSADHLQEVHFFQKNPMFLTSVTSYMPIVFLQLCRHCQCARPVWLLVLHARQVHLVWDHGKAKLRVADREATSIVCFSQRQCLSYWGLCEMRIISARSWPGDWFLYSYCIRKFQDSSSLTC